MPHHLGYESNDLGVLITLSGLIKADEISELNEELMSDELFRQWHYQIWDFSDVERLELTESDLRRFAMQDARASRINPNQKVALIRRRNPSSSGLDTIYHIFGDVWGGYESRTFSDYDTARKWAFNGQRGDSCTT
jgi:hypothetical protein